MQRKRFSNNWNSKVLQRARDEYILLKALHRSLMKNVYQVEGIKLLVDGKEVDTIGGHLSVRGLLGEAVSVPFRGTHER